jgi:peptidoglycan/LPS O-acetylase OafA/YrhL
MAEQREHPSMNKLRRLHLRNLELMATSTLFRRRRWNSVIFGPLLIIFCIVWLVIVNAPSHGGFLKNLGANLVLGIGVAFLTAGTLHSGKLLRDYYRLK